MILFATSIFLSAFLLFQIQPMIGKFILPWFGGTPAVWTTVMLFFQVLLTGGYGYAYGLINRGKGSRQSVVHIVLTALAILLMVGLGFLWASPITPPASMKPVDVTSPILDIFQLLVISVGLPYFILASNGPIMQAWFSRIFPERSYARLYSLSNLGSLLGLLAYPVFIEPNLSLINHGWIWSAGFVIFGVLTIRISYQVGKITQPASMESHDAPSGRRPSYALLSLWIVLSGAASLLLLSVTSQISQEVAVIPFLWILPLTLYLLSFIITFSGERGYNRKFYLTLFAASVVLLLFVLLNIETMHIYLQIVAYCLLMFSACMLCHGELYLLRPSARYLTTFYFMVSVGGAVGGIFASLVAPLIFNGYWEFVVSIALAVALWLTILRPARLENHATWTRFMISVFLLATLSFTVLDDYFGMLFSERNFFGIVRVNKVIPEGATEFAYEMTHGITIHGTQFIDPGLRILPTTYFVNGSGVNLALLNHPRAGKGMKVGVLGLGVGTLAVYGQPDDEYRMYEINSNVIDLAEGLGGYFSYLRDSKAEITTVLGDARISLESELAAGGSRNFDVLVLDVFSSDSVPMHLLTKEAFDLYLKHLAPDGIIAANITNRHVDLQPVFWKLAQYYDLSIVMINHAGSPNGGRASDWLLLARDPVLLEIPAIQTHAVDLSRYSTDIQLWTDDYSNLFQILK
jgi:hypothetical protein